MKINQSALTKLKSMITSQSPWMRIEIRAGGCNGFEKIYTLTDQLSADDLIFENIVVVDPISYELISQSELSYEKDLSGNRFVLTIPESTTNCGCGKSFNI